MRLFIIFLTLFIAAIQIVNGQTWTGNINSDWHEAGNWDKGKLPRSNSTVNIGFNVSGVYPEITQDVTVSDIIISDWNSGQLTVKNEATLTISKNLTIQNNGKLLIDNGTLQFNGNGKPGQNINMSSIGTSIEIINSGTFNSPNGKFTVNGELILNNGTINLGNGFELAWEKFFKVTEGSVNIFGQTNIYGTVDGGIGNFIFNGDASDSNHKITITGGGRFFMAPSASDNLSLDCPSDTPDNPEHSGGTVDFYTPCDIKSSGFFYGGNAYVTFHKSMSPSGNAIIETHNGTLLFKEDLTAGGTASINITCKGTIHVYGNTTLQSSGYINAVSGNIYFDGNLRTENSSGEINAGSSTIFFSGESFVNEGYFNAGTSTFVFNGGGSQVFGTYNWRPDNTFYNLIVENNSNVQSTHNVLVLNDMEVSDGSSFNIDSGKTLNVIGEIIGDANIETNRPYIITIVINTMNSITAVFNEPLDPVSAQTASNYRIEDKNGNTINNPINPLLGGVNNNEVTLTLGFDIQQDVTYYLIVNNVYNLNNFAVNSNHKKRFLLKEDKDLWQWSGAIDNDWDKPGNWSKNKIPKTSSQVVIPVTVNNPVILSLNNTISKLQIKTGASLTIGPMGSLLVSDSILNSEGEAGLIIASTSEGTGSLVHFNDDVNATFQRYISGEPQAWQMISSPIAGQSISGDFTPTGGSDAYGDGTRYDFYTWYEPDTSWVYLLNDDQAPTWLTANGSSNFVTGKGYLISYKDLHPTKEFKGLLNNGTVSVQLTNTHNGAIQFGHNLLGNPYPSSIDWKATSGWNRDVLEDNNGGYDFWVWSEENLNYGVYNSASSSDIGTLGVSRYIAPTQGFFVKAKQSGAFSMNNQVRVSDGASNWLKSSIAVQNNISITIESLAGSGQDEVRIEFGYRETEGGALKKFSFVPSSPSLFLPADGEFYSIRSLSEPENHPVVPLSFKAGVSGSYKISANFSLNDFETLILIDRQTGVRHNFNESKTYDFSANSNDKPERFVLQVMPGEYANPYEVLPVHIFTAEKRLNIDLRLIEGEYICEVFSITGQILIKSNVYGGELTTLEIPSLSGVFMVQVSGKQGRKSQKVVVY